MSKMTAIFIQYILIFKLLIITSINVYIFSALLLKEMCKGTKVGMQDEVELLEQYEDLDKKMIEV